MRISKGLQARQDILILIVMFNYLIVLIFFYVVILSFFHIDMQRPILMVYLLWLEYFVPTVVFVWMFQVTTKYKHLEVISIFLNMQFFGHLFLYHRTSNNLLFVLWWHFCYRWISIFWISEMELGLVQDLIHNIILTSHLRISIFTSS